MLIKKVNLVIKNVFTEIFGSQLEKIWKNQKLAKLEKLMSKKKDWFLEIL